MKFSVIAHVTTYCNYDCSYCDVVKDNKKLSPEAVENLKLFINKNKENIESFKFFWWEPTIAFTDINNIISHTHLWMKFHIVTNTSLLSEKIWEVFSDNFSRIFFSIDSENSFDYDYVTQFILKYSLWDRVFFNLIIDPDNVLDALNIFYKLVSKGCKKFNILPVYFKKPWTKDNLKALAQVLKSIVDSALKDNEIVLYWFQENKGYDSSLYNNVLFIDIDGSVYLSDIVSTFNWKPFKNNLFLWRAQEIDISMIWTEKIEKLKKEIYTIETYLSSKIQWQSQLHELMDYFSHYLNTKSKEHGK